MLTFQKSAVKTVCGLPIAELDYALHMRMLGFTQHTVLRSVRCSCRSAQGTVALDHLEFRFPHEQNVLRKQSI